MANIAKNMMLIRKASGLSRREMGEWFKLSERAIRHMESGNGTIPADRLLVISQRLNIPINCFFDDEVTRKVVGEILIRKFMSGSGV